MCEPMFYALKYVENTPKVWLLFLRGKNPMYFPTHGYKRPGNSASLLIITQYQKYSRHLMHTCLIDTFSSNEIVAVQVFIFKPLLFYTLGSHIYITLAFQSQNLQSYSAFFPIDYAKLLCKMLSIISCLSAPEFLP